MGLGSELIQAHIDHWSNYFKKTNRPYRQHWPARLFGHEPVQNAARILRSGVLLSRRTAQGFDKLDIAAPRVIGSRSEAHSYVRLYFRPKNPTQYRVEGILKPHEYYQGDSNTHAPILVMLIFKAPAILALDEVLFSDGNMQSLHTQYEQTEEFFNKINFGYVYHDGPFESGTEQAHEITRARCADLWTKRIRVYSEPGLFQNDKAYIDTVDADSEGISFSLHPRKDGQSVELSLSISDIIGTNKTNLGPWRLDPKTRWRLNHKFNSGLYLCTITVDHCLAYESTFLIDSLPF